MIETMRWLARPNSGVCCQIENFFRWLGCRHKKAERADARRCFASQRLRGDSLKATRPERARADLVRRSRVCRHRRRMRGGLLRSGRLDQPKLGQRGHAVVEADLL